MDRDPWECPLPTFSFNFSERKQAIAAPRHVYGVQALNHGFTTTTWVCECERELDGTVVCVLGVAHLCVYPAQ